MAALDMATITDYLERSMQNCSLSVGDGLGRSSMMDDSDEHIPISDRFLDLNSHLSIPSHLQQCLDLKTGEIYYVNWNTGMRVNEDPRISASSNDPDQFSGESYGTVFSEEDSSYCESEEFSSESSLSSRENRKEEEEKEEEEVLVVAGCKACFMYFMVPKLLEYCPKCAAQLLHFDRSHSASP